MGNIISLMHVSLDGFTAGPNGELEWAAVDEEMYQGVADALGNVDTALYGRVTYHMMESYWPTVPANPDSSPGELQHAQWIEKISKVVISTTITDVVWKNTRVVRDHIAEELRALKQQGDGDIMLFGSPSIARLLLQLGLLDEYRLTVNPVILGSGVPLFPDITTRIPLKLLETKTYHSGVVGLHYQIDTV